jgi:hypothetical protein
MSKPKDTDTLFNFPNWVEAIAAMAEFDFQKLGENLVAITCQLNGGRSQTVWVSPIGRDRFKNTVITIASPALKLGAAGRSLPKEQANNLLRHNAKLCHGAWAIQNIEGDDYLVMYDTQIAETMDTMEFATSVKDTAALADAMEKKLGKDQF